MIYVLPAREINARFDKVHPWYMSCLVYGGYEKGVIGTMNIHMTCRFYSSLCGVARIRNIKGNEQSINPSVLLSLRNSDQGAPTKTSYPSKAHSIFPGPKSFSQPFIPNHGDLDPLSASQTWSPFTPYSLVRRTRITSTIEPLF